MQQKLVILSLLLVSFQVKASLRELIAITFKRNLNIEQARLEVENTAFDKEILESQFSLRLDLESKYIDSNFERDPFSLVSANTTWSNDLILSKSFSWGGELALATTHRQLSPKASLPKSYLFEQRLSFTQDLGRNFFGRALKDEVEAASLNKVVAQLELTNKEKEQLIGISSLYVEGASLQAIMLLEKAAIKRVQKRLSYVRRQVKDGIRERVDELRARENLLARDTALRDLANRLWALREEMGALIVGNAIGVEFNSDGLEQDWTKAWKGWHLKENVDRQILLKRLEVLNAQARSRRQKNSTDIKLVTSYGTNNWELNRSDAISDGFLGGENDEATVGIQVSFPWGNEASKAEFGKIEAQRMMLERYSKNWSSVLLNTATTLGERHKILADNLKTAIDRVNLARQALEAYNKLYSKGRVDLDQVITAEEQLIADQKLVVSSRQALVILTLEAQALAGRLPQFLLAEVEL